MKVYVVTYVNRNGRDIHLKQRTFRDYDKAVKEYELKRLLALEMARDDDPDLDEECPRDYSIVESRFRCDIHVTESEEDYLVTLSEHEPL